MVNKVVISNITFTVKFIQYEGYKFVLLFISCFMLFTIKNVYRKLKWQTLLVSIFLIAVSNYSFSQSIKGQIVDEKGESIPYASVFVKELSLGVASNVDGMFNIKVPPGEYHVVFQSLGFNSENREVSVGQTDINLKIILTTRYYNLAAVKVSSKSEDPAYSIMRKAIGLAPYHRSQVKSYSSQVYMKGKVSVLKLSRLVKRMLRKEEDAPQEGEIYVHESYSDLSFREPNSYEQNVISVRNTFPGNDSNDAMQFIALNLYQPTYERWISPLAPNAFTHYRFKYLGSSVESDRMIHQIAVIPRRKNQQLLEGTLHIVDNLYCFHSVDLKGEFTGGKFRFSSQFAEFNRNLWMPVSHKIDMDIKVMGNNAEVNYLASVSYKDVVTSDALATFTAEPKQEVKIDEKPKQSPKTPKQVKNQQKIDELMQKDELTTRDMHQLSKLMSEQQKQQQPPDTSKSLEIQRRTKMKVDSLASTRDSAYWEQLRPIPLKQDELKSFQKKDSLVRIAGPDSLRKHGEPSSIHRSSMAKVALTGGWYRTKSKKFSFQSDGINPASFAYNTVDGFVPSYSFTVGVRVKKKMYSLSQNYSYAFARKEFMYSLTHSQSYAPLRRGRFNLSVGSKSKDFNLTDGVNTFVNSITTLTLRENFQRLYHEKWASAGNSIDLANGLVLKTNLKFFIRDSLVNNTNYSFFYKDVKDFSPNIPDNSLYANTLKNVSLGSLLNVTVEYTPEYYYRMFGETKWMVRSKYPTFHFKYYLYNYLKDEKFLAHSVQVGLTQNKNLSLFRDFYYSFNIGSYINAEKLHFADFRHFNTQPIYVVFNEVNNTFCNLPFYAQSTSKQWAEFHTYYRSAFLALKFLPFFSNMYWKETVFLDILSTRENPYYIEVGYGTNEILQSIRVSGHVGYMHDGNFYYGFRIGIKGNSIGI